MGILTDEVDIVAGPGPGTFDLNIFPENTAIGEKVWARALLQVG